MRKWTEEKIADELRRITGAIGSFPTVSELRSMGRNDLTCAVTKHGGMIAWAERLGLSRKQSDSDFGWEGERAFCAICQLVGLNAVRSEAVKAPFDVLVESVLRVDVKSTNFSDRGACRGWFYRIGKIPQADLIVLYQADTGDFYGVPWWACPTTNVTLSRGGGKYAQYRNNWDLIRRMVHIRKAEQAAGQVVPEVA